MGKRGERKQAKNRDNKGRKKDRKKNKGPTMAERADRHALYEEAVQCVEAEIDFVDEWFEKLRGRKASLLREDFSGTANTSCEWVRRRPTNRAIAVDLDPEVQEWGRENRVAKLGEAASRVELINADVLDVDTPTVECLLAMNFSYWLFKRRPDLLRYFRRVRDTLADDGVFFLDCYGGYEAMREMRESTKNDGFTYIWDQAKYDPITGDYTCKIHFKFPDGSRWNDAYSYEWRLWTLPEVRELLDEAGFSRVTVYWQGEEDTGEGDGEFLPAERGEADAAWIVYITAEK